MAPDRAAYDGGARAVTAKPRLAVRLHGGMRVADCIAQAAAAEAAGFASVWFAENPFARGILPAAAACALATRRIAIGAGVFNPFNRHPSLIAMEIGALDELSAGRVRLGIGSGIGSAIERMGLSYARPLTAVAEAIAIVRALLRGEEVTYRGKLFSVERVKLDYAPRRDIAIFMAGRGDASLKLAGEVADGLILSNMCTPVLPPAPSRSVSEARRAQPDARACPRWCNICRAASPPIAARPSARRDARSATCFPSFGRSEGALRRPGPP